MDISMCFSSLVILLAASAGIHSLKLISLDVPMSVRKGEAVWLNCSLDYEDSDLYSIKWYKDDIEFYRYLPEEDDFNQQQTYESKGVYVNVSLSAEGQVYLSTTDFETDGFYRCEASAESPSFQTVEAVQEMRTYALPEEEPTIEGIQPNYAIGDEINVTCIAGASKPAAKLTWYINDQQVPANYVVKHDVIKQKDGLKISSMTLNFIYSDEHIDKDTKLECRSTVSAAYFMTSKELVIGDKTPPTESSGELLPTISGAQLSYKTGDILDVNCTSPQERDAPELQWFVNNIKAAPKTVKLYPTSFHKDGLESTVLNLGFTVEQINFDASDEMKLKCTSTLSRVINTKRGEITVKSNRRISELHVAENRAENRAATDGVPTLQTGGLLLLLTLLPFL